MQLILATFLALLCVLFALGVALLARRAPEKPQEAPKKQERRNAEYVTAEQLEERLAKFAKAQEWEMDEWYEKFSTLHARLAKRQQRQRKQEEQEEFELEEEPAPSVVHLRRLGSV